MTAFPHLQSLKTTTMNQPDNQNNKKDMTLNSAGLSLFNGDNYFYHVFKKTQKILSAAYLITDFISDTDPIKQAIRDAGLALYKSAAEMSISASPNRKNVLDKFFSCGLSLISFCQVSSQAGMMSVMNAEIMSDEIRMLMQAVEEREVPHKLGRSFVISRDLLQTDTIPQSAVSESANHYTNQNGQSHGVGHSAKQGFGGEYKKANAGSATASRVSQGVSSSGAQRPQQRPSYDLASSGSTQEKDNSRRQKIVDLIKMKGEVSIKDISDNFFDCSEKTIQRELISLVEDGVLSRTGERRWSRYSIAK